MSGHGTTGDDHGARTPPDESPPTATPPKQVAGGMAAVGSTLRRAARETGLVRGAGLLLRANQHGGFDCPGCAWPDPDDRRAMVEFCENGAKAIVDEATRKRIGASFFERHSITELSGQTDRWLGSQGRITEPVIRRPGDDHYRPVTWRDAFGLIAAELRALDTPDQAVFYTSGRTSNEAAFLYQLFVRLFGTNNLPDCSNMCHESSGTALAETIGIGKGTVTLEDFDQADCIIVIGQNPGSNHPRMLTALQRAARGGAAIISINPLRETGLVRFRHPQQVRGWIGRGTPLARWHLPVRINGDVALLTGIIKALFEAEVDNPGSIVDRDFIDRHTDGYKPFAASIRAASWNLIETESGVSRDQIIDTAALIGRSRRVICCWAMGLTQHENAVANIQQIVNLLLLGGNIGRPGAGACPVRGHSNVQGDRTMGIWERPTDAFLDRLGSAVGFEPPRRHGYDTVAAIEAMHSRDARVFVGLGGNFLSATPDTDFTAEALRRTSLTVQISTKLNRSHLITGATALILPCLGRTERDRQAGGEQFVTTENSMGVVQTSRGDLAPASADLKSEVAIVAGIAQATLSEPSSSTTVDWRALTADYDAIRDLIERSVAGFDAYNERVRKPGGFALPNPVRDERRFQTATGTARFTVHQIEPTQLPQDQFLMMTIRSHDQYNTTVYGNDDRYRGISGGRRVVLVNAQDLTDAGIAPGDPVDLTSHHRGRTRTAERFITVPYEIPRGCVATYFPEANVLVPIDQKARGSNTPASKSVRVTLVRS